MNADVGEAQRGPRGLARAGLLGAVLAAAALLAAGCGGGGHKAGTSSGSGTAGNTIARLDGYAQCMRTHGVPGFYLSTQTNAPGADGAAVLKLAPGVIVPGVNPFTAQYASANKACQHLMPKVGKTLSAAQQRRLLRQMVKGAACMRTHGYPSWPDPSIQDGGVVDPGPPPNVDQNSPQFQAAGKACGPA